MPIGSPGHSGAVGILPLVTAHAIQRGHTLTGWAADNIREMSTPVIALLWIVCRRVTVDAAWRSQDRIDLLPRGQPVGDLRIARGGFPFTDLEGTDC